LLDGRESDCDNNIDWVVLVLVLLLQFQRGTQIIMATTVANDPLGEPPLNRLTRLVPN
jgi:hypothetical protein